MGSSSRNLAAVILKRLEFCRTTIQQNISVGKSKLRPLPGLREDEHDRHDEEHRVDAAAAAAAATAAVVVVVLSSAAIVAVADARVGVVGVLSFIHPVRHHRQYQEEGEFCTLFICNDRTICSSLTSHASNM